MKSAVIFVNLQPNLFSATEMSHRLHRFAQMIKKVLLILLLELMGTGPVSSATDMEVTDTCHFTVNHNPSVKEEIQKDVSCAAGVNKAYITAVKGIWTPVPEGKAPFAIISYGRHGSCYLGKPANYDAPLKV